MDKPTRRIIRLKPYTKKELAAIYSVDRRTFAKWVDDLNGTVGPPHGRFYLIPQVRIIFQELGVPVDCIVEGLQL